MLPIFAFKAFRAVAITNGDTKYSAITKRSDDAHWAGHFAYGVTTTQTVATLAVAVTLQFNNLPEADYQIALAAHVAGGGTEQTMTTGWYTHEAVSPVAFSGTASHDIGATSKPWRRTRLKAVCTGGTGAIDADGEAG